MYATTITFPNGNYDWHYTVTLPNFQILFNSRFRSWLVFNFLFLFIFYSGVKLTCNINNQALLFYFIHYRLVVFNLVVSLYFEVAQQLVVRGFIQWLWRMVVVTSGLNTSTQVIAHVIHVFLIPVITQHSTYKISPSKSPAPSCLTTSILLLSKFLAFLKYNMANCLITFSAILHFAGTFC